MTFVSSAQMGVSGQKFFVTPATLSTSPNLLPLAGVTDEIGAPYTRGYKQRSRKRCCCGCQKAKVSRDTRNALDFS